ncbi:tyrosine-type recombinase/integrase [Acrocarpospora sp. B8E8]|uniref:tyrosine-type recombinase/integrase n=1 Tax=Acrocarpospora sp. B8E8 TaxID=3153572 RepID=UPI00325EAD89
MQCHSPRISSRSRPFRRALPTRRSQIGLPPEFAPHSLRDFFASTALAARIPITEVSRWLGHQNTEITHQTYGHLVPASIGRAREILDGLFNRPDMG